MDDVGVPEAVDALYGSNPKVSFAIFQEACGQIAGKTVAACDTLHTASPETQQPLTGRPDPHVAGVIAQQHPGRQRGVLQTGDHRLEVPLSEEQHPLAGEIDPQYFSGGAFNDGTDPYRTGAGTDRPAAGSPAA